jgi:hypothetical protein
MRQLLRYHKNEAGKKGEYFSGCLVFYNFCAFISRIDDERISSFFKIVVVTVDVHIETILKTLEIKAQKL